MIDAPSFRVVRPYATEEEFLEAEAWTINVRSLLLIGIEPHPEGTIARVELALKTGKSLIVAEGSVAKHLATSPSRPAGLVVRFRRMSAASSEFVKRAVARNAERPQASSPLASTVAQADPAQSSALAIPPVEASAASIPPTREPEPATPPSHRTFGPARSSVPPKGTQRSVPPEGPPSGRPEGPERPRSVSVVPAARRVSTQPPPESSAAALTPGALPAAPKLPATRQDSQRAEPPPSVKRGSDETTAPKVASGRSHRDTDAMARLRERHGSKPITVPPDREAILARLKKP